MFITFEGGEGTGKSTLIHALFHSLQTIYPDVFLTREPGGSESGQLIRNLLLHQHFEPLSEVFLFSAARFEHLKHSIIPVLDRGGIVLCDRFSDSTLAYQGYGLGLDLSFLKTIEDTIVTRQPDMTFILDLDPTIAQQRVHHRGNANHIDQRPLSFHEKVRQGFLDIAATNTQRYCVVDGNQSPESLLHCIQSILYPRLTSFMVGACPQTKIS